MANKTTMKTECLNVYVSDINQQYKTQRAREHSYRPALKNLLQTLLPTMIVTNEPAHIDCGAPDYIIQRAKDNLPVFFVEAKDVNDKDLDGKNKKGHKEQFDRYKHALDYIIFTDYLDFHLYEHGELVECVRIAEIDGNNIIASPEAEERFLGMIQHLATIAIQRVISAKQLAKLMAGKARLLANIIEKAMNEETQSYENDNLHAQYNAFKDVLIQELKIEDFADIYSQTIAYGMFAARLHDDTPDDFSREEAARLIPKTNPFLRQIFNNLAGNDLDERIAWVVDDLAMVFQATDLQKIMANYSNNKQHHDPMIHFYEDFLSEYDPKLRKAKGVWYTPQPIVGFIVRAVDNILQKEFGLIDGLADYSKIEKDVAVEQSRDKRKSDGMKHEKRSFHKVQILDPATGTGTFLAEVVNQIYDRYRNQQGVWQQYVEQHLLPRLNGFEILMASYAVAHIKLDMLLAETGYQHKTDKRLHVYLTNSLEESNKEPRTLFAHWLSQEAAEANVIKRDRPVMVMIGNPPYSGISQNNGEWIVKLIDDYKKEPGGKEKLKERKTWLNDDYVKFIRLAQDYIDRNEKGIIGYINNNGFLDNPTFRGMRWNLLRSFDLIYILNLHGNAMQNEIGEKGEKDENVFDIRQGVSINIFVKTGKKSKNDLGEVFYADLYGNRKYKYDKLNNLTFLNTAFEKLNIASPLFRFVPQNSEGKDDYNQGFSINELMPINVTGLVTARDRLVINSSKEKLREIISTFTDDTLTDEEIRQLFFSSKYKNVKSDNKYLPGDSRGWKLSQARKIIKNFSFEDKTKIISYRPFDNQYIYYCKEMVDWGREDVFGKMAKKDNLILVVSRQAITDNWSHVLATSNMCDNRYFYSNKGISQACPLYLYQKNMGKEERIVNFNKNIYEKIARGLNYLPSYDDNILIDPTSDYNGVLYPQDLFDYIYAVLHCPSYREHYKEFLKIDFPRIPYPTDWENFRDLAEKGKALRLLHLMEDLPRQNDVSFPIGGTLQIDCYCWRENRVYINSEQYFEGVPETAWKFYIGGYQPAQKWLKDRKGQMLRFEDVQHYCKIIYVLQQTERLMKEIDAII